MNKIATICLRCGKVQIRTDMIENINGMYINLKNSRMCPGCQTKTKHIATKQIKTLRIKLEERTSNHLEEHILELIKRK